MNSFNIYQDLLYLFYSWNYSEKPTVTFSCFETEGFFRLYDSIRGILAQLHMQKQISLFHKDYYINGYNSMVCLYTCEFLPLSYSIVVSHILAPESGRYLYLIWCKIFHKSMIISLRAKDISYKLLARKSNVHVLSLTEKNILLNWLDSPIAYKNNYSWSCNFSESMRVFQAKTSI